MCRPAAFQVFEANTGPAQVDRATSARDEQRARCLPAGRPRRDDDGGRDLRAGRRLGGHRHADRRQAATATRSCSTAPSGGSPTAARPTTTWCTAGWPTSPARRASARSWSTPTRPASASARRSGSWASAASRRPTSCFDDVAVPAANLVVPAGGFRKLFSVFSIERLGNATMSLAIAQAALDRTIAYVQEREQFGRQLVEFQSVQMTLADMVHPGRGRPAAHPPGGGQRRERHARCRTRSRSPSAPPTRWPSASRTWRCSCTAATATPRSTASSACTATRTAGRSPAARRPSSGSGSPRRSSDARSTSARPRWRHGRTCVRAGAGVRRAPGGGPCPRRVRRRHRRPGRRVLLDRPGDARAAARQRPGRGGGRAGVRRPVPRRRLARDDRGARGVRLRERPPRLAVRDAGHRQLPDLGGRRGRRPQALAARRRPAGRARGARAHRARRRVRPAGDRDHRRAGRRRAGRQRAQVVHHQRRRRGLLLRARQGSGRVHAGARPDRHARASR